MMQAARAWAGPVAAVRWNRIEADSSRHSIGHPATEPADTVGAYVNDIRYGP